MKATQLYRKHNGENSVTPFNVRDKASIKLVRQQKGWGAKRICNEFPNKNCIGRSVPLKIFCAKLTRQTRFLERSVVDGSGLSEQHRISSV